MLDWDNLRFFLTVARAGSMSAAARVLQVAQPTVGRRIASLEQALGAELFLPTRSGQALSRTGQRILEHAERMELCARVVEGVASARDPQLRGRVCITSSEWMIGSVLSPLLGPLLAQHPQLELELLADTRHLNLLRREADIAVRPSKFEQPDVAQRQVGKLAFGLYVADIHVRTYGLPDFGEQCANYALITMSESLTQVPDKTWLAQFAGRARVVARSNGREAMLAMVVAGIGMACLPRFLGDRCPGLQLLSTPSSRPERVLWLGLQRSSRALQRVRSTAVFLEQRLREIEPDLCPAALS